MHNLIAFIKKLRVFLFFLFLQIITLYTYVSYMSVPKSSVFTSASYVSGTLYEIKHSVTKHFHLSENNENLQKENIRLRKQNPLFLYKKNRALQSTNDTLYAQQYDYIPATIINSSTTNRNNFFTIDAGKMQGIKRGLGVFSSNGIVGIVHNCSKHFSVVKSVLTSDINIDVMIVENGAFGLLKWNGENPRFGSISGITNDIKIKKGSRVITRGGSGIFPKGLNVGTVHSIAPLEGKPLHFVKLEFAEKYGALQNVYIVKNKFLNEMNRLQLEQ